jgi:MSHA biogenesis protein MshO
MTKPTRSPRGFTLIEMIMVIVITGVIAGMVAVFIKGPVDSYFDMARRAELTDAADTAVRRMGRDIRLALPNSVRNPVDGSDQCIEFMPTKSGGRYRADQTAALTGDTLDFTTADPNFDMLGLNGSLPVEAQIAAGDIVVVYNDGSNSGNAYTGANAVQVAAGGVAAGDTANTTKLSFVPAGATIFARKAFPSASPASRFQVLPSTEQVAAFACNAGTLARYSRNITARTTPWAQPANCAAMTAGATSAVLAKQVSACSIKYEPPGSGSGGGRFGMVSISLAATRSGESVNLYHQVHVDNTP